MLEYKFTNDTLFKMLFIEYPDLLRRLIAELLSIPVDTILQMEVSNPEMPPEEFGGKFCRLDINMIVDGQRVDLEIQVRDEGDYPERSLYYWARDFSSALPEGGDYIDLPRTVVVSITGFQLFDCPEFHSEFQPLEVTRHSQLTDRMSLHYFELPKLPAPLSADNSQLLWLKLFAAQSEEDLQQIQALEVPIMDQAISAYRKITATPEFHALERMRSDRLHNEAAALRHAAEEAAKEERQKWQLVVTEKETALEQQKNTIANKDAEIARLRAQLEGK